MQELRLTRFHELGGALFRPEAGWSVPAGYGSVDAEVRRVRHRAGMIDRSDRAKIEPELKKLNLGAIEVRDTEGKSVD